MAKEDPELKAVESEEEYEMVPLTPLRRLEKRLEALESTRTVANLERFIDKVIDMVELNQKMVDEVVRSNVGLREDVAVLIGKMDELYTRMGDFINAIKSMGEAEPSAAPQRIAEQAVMPVVSKIDDMARRLQEGMSTMAETLASIDRKLKTAQPVAARPATLLARRPIEAAPAAGGAQT